MDIFTNNFRQFEIRREFFGYLLHNFNDQLSISNKLETSSPGHDKMRRREREREIVWAAYGIEDSAKNSADVADPFLPGQKLSPPPPPSLLDERKIPLVRSFGSARIIPPRSFARGSPILRNVSRGSFILRNSVSISRMEK